MSTAGRKSLFPGALDGRVVLVTGGTRGIGRAIAYAMGEAGADVLVTGRDHETGAACLEGLRPLGVRAAFLPADLSDDRAVDELIPRAIAEFGRIDILVNNAGIDPVAQVLDCSLEQWRAVHRMNLEVPFRLSQAAVRDFLARQGGVIINVASVLGLIGGAGQAAYAASKHGLVGLTKVLAIELAGRGVRVNAIAPGLVQTEMSRFVWEDASVIDRFMSRMPLRRLGQPDDIAGLAVLLASDAGAFIHGQIIPVDGGRLAG